MAVVQEDLIQVVVLNIMVALVVVVMDQVIVLVLAQEVHLQEVAQFMEMRVVVVDLVHLITKVVVAVDLAVLEKHISLL
jgi:hypothetical protein